MVNMTKIHSIIHVASITAAGVGGGLAQLPMSDMPILKGIQATMITGIAWEHGISITKSTAAKLLLTFMAGTVGRATSEILIGWIPGIGNVINATTAASITEAIGWAAHRHFEVPNA